ncbi:alpha/beta hydrolase [Embleya scabrispora]|uniref:alpha/beta hydrolase n=1 Tax=Embleya scabrispora TaxID=159449 RepID=UPI000365744D|nr:alpha/beta fold hydrolase [Embleya scabrispora]MYS79011.1 alpha/beta fold hydrolase [Streptomyces sp. SID5474]
MPDAQASTGPLAALRTWSPPNGTDVRAVVLVLPGGRARSRQPASTRNLAYRRMVPIARGIHRATRAEGAATWLLRYRVRGWNEPDRDPVQDAWWALDGIRARYPRAEVTLVGHSMGGRTALRVAEHESVRTVCALAPWIEDDEPYAHLAGRDVVIVHGTADHTTSPKSSHRYALAAREVSERVCRFELPDGHAMMRRAPTWTELIRRTVVGSVTGTPDPGIARAMTAPDPDGLRAMVS